MPLDVPFGAQIKIKQNIKIFIKMTYLFSKLKPFKNVSMAKRSSISKKKKKIQDFPASL